MSKYINNLNISANTYADNLFKAISHFDKHKNCKSVYEIEVGNFYDRCVAVFKVNRLRCQEADITKFEKSIRGKANKRIRQMIQTAEKELQRIEKDRFSLNLLETCSKFSVKLETVKKIIK